MEHIQDLRYEDKPDYELLQNLFRTAITRRGYKDSDVFDWEKEGNGVENEQPVQVNSVPPAPQQPLPTSLNTKVSAYVVNLDEMTRRCLCLPSDMTKAMMTGQPGSTLASRQQATEADAIDDRWKGSKEHSPFSPRRAVPKSLDRTTRRGNPIEKETSLSKNHQGRTSIINSSPGDHPKDSWKTNALSELSQRLRRPTTSKSSAAAAADPLTPVNKFLSKEDSPASASHSDPAKPRNPPPSSVQNRSYQMIPLEASTTQINADETPSPAAIMFTSAGSIEHGKPPKTPRTTRTTNSRSDGVVVIPSTPIRQMSLRTGDSEAMSMPAATFAIKAGAQTVMSQWVVSLDDNLDDEGSDNQHSAKWEDAQEKLQSTTHEPTQYHPAVTSLSPPPLIPPSNLPTIGSNMPYNVMLNSNSSGLGPAMIVNGVSIPTPDTLPFENYRTHDLLPQSNIVSHSSQNNNYAGANPASDDDDDDDEEANGPDKRRSTTTIPPSRTLNMLTLLPSSLMRKSPSASTTLMMMMNSTGNERREGSSSSSSSLPMDERQQRDIQTRRFHFVPVPFNGSRLITKSTDQLNQSIVINQNNNTTTSEFVWHLLILHGIRLTMHLLFFHFDHHHHHHLCC